MGILSQFLNAALQVAAFSLIPFIWWFFTARHNSRFFSWLGLEMPVIIDKKAFWLVLMCGFAAFMLMGFFVIPLVAGSVDLAASNFSGQGWNALIPALIFAFIQTALSEEIFFRGFLGKRLSNRFGFAAGNIMQALLFGLLHGAMFFAFVGVVKALVVILFTGLIGWTMGYLNEKHAGGSILPGWLMHGLSNLVTALAAMFAGI